jgi:ABC-2 type transport system permease protein
MRQASAARAMWLIARLRLQRLANMLTRFGKPKPGARSATPARRRMGGLFSALVGAAMLLSLLNVSRQSLLNMQCYLAPDSACVQGPRGLDFATAALELHAAPLPHAVQLALALQLSMLFLVSVMLPLGSRDIAAADWDLEWLVTLPARRATLLWGRIAERTLVNPTGWILLAPCCSVIAWYAGCRWSAPLAGIAASLCLLPLAAMLRTLADTGLRMSLAPSQLRNVQAVTAIAGMPLMYLAYAFGTMHTGSPVLDIARQVPEWILWTPPGLLLRVIDHPAPAPLALLLLEVLVPLAAGMLVLRFQLRHGVVGSGARESARAARPARASALARLLPASPIKRRELRLLARDRNFLIQSLLLPLIVVGSQLAFSGSADALSEIAASPVFLACMAFGIGSYMLMLSAFQTLNNEGQTLWMLYTFPRSLESVLREKAQFWAVLALLYPLLILGAGLAAAPGLAPAILSRFAVALAGIPIFATIAVALGVFASDPLSQDARNKIKPSHAYLYLMLSGLYLYAISSKELAQQLVLVALMAALAVALWQKARAQLPYLLDPALAPPPRTSSADGLIAAMLFFVAQGAVFAALRDRSIAFAVGGVLVVALLRLVYLLSKTSGVPVMLAGSLTRSVAWGASGGLAAAAFGLSYARLVAPASAGPAETGWPSLLAIVVAPYCVEFIFRGLVFGGLQRSMKLLPAMLASAALFAIMHPPAAMLPMFVLGLCCAFAWRKTGALLAPILVHLIYNTTALI